MGRMQKYSSYFATNTLLDKIFGLVPPANQKRTEPRTDAPKYPHFHEFQNARILRKSHFFQKLKKHPDFQVTSCLRFVSTDVKFDE